MAERFTVDEDVAGSSPVSHPSGLLFAGGLFLFGGPSRLLGRRNYTGTLCIYQALPLPIRGVRIAGYKRKSLPLLGDPQAFLGFLQGTLPPLGSQHSFRFSLRKLGAKPVAVLQRLDERRMSAAQRLVD
jgi:hypothetical protein